MVKIFNNPKLKMLPRVYEIIENADQHEYEQIFFYTLDRIWTCHLDLYEMTKKQLKKFEDSILKVCRYKRWIK